VPAPSGVKNTPGPPEPASRYCSRSIKAGQTAYVIYGPGGTPIYQINKTGEVIYLHQDHQGSTRLTTNANGTTRNTITYNAHGEITANTNWWLEQPLNGYTGQYHDTETGYIYLRARHYDPTTGQFTTLDPLVAITEEPYGYTGGNPANGSDPSGLCGFLGDGPCSPVGIAEDINDRAGQARELAGICNTKFDEGCTSYAEARPGGTQHVVDVCSGFLAGSSLGLAKGLIGDRARWGEPGTAAGWVIGGVSLVPFAIFAAPLFNAISITAGAFDAWNGCAASDSRTFKGCVATIAVWVMAAGFAKGISGSLPASAGGKNGWMQVITGAFGWMPGYEE
jgi:RHS repeat-associated protein